jgi:hypothetical protein
VAGVGDEAVPGVVVAVEVVPGGWSWGEGGVAGGDALGVDVGDGVGVLWGHGADGGHGGSFGVVGVADTSRWLFRSCFRSVDDEFCTGGGGVFRVSGAA